MTSAAVLLALAVLVPHAAVTGVIRSADGAPIAGAQVTAVEPGRIASATTDATGTFTLTVTSLPATLDVTARGYAPLRRAVTASPVEIVLNAAGVTESVVVAADRAPAWRDATTGATVLSASDLDRLPAITLDESLRAVSGFSLFRRSSASTSNPTTHGVTMRGLSASGSSRALVLLDGIPFNDGFGGWVTWTRLPPDAEGRVDVERGAEGDAVGSDALGGVIRILTPAVDRPMWVVGGESGTDGVGAADAAGGRRQGRVGLFGATSWFRTDGAIPIAPESRGPVDVPADATWTNALGRVDLPFGHRRLSIEGWGSRDDRGNGTVLQRNRMSGGTVAATFDTVERGTTIAARVSFSPNRFQQSFTTVSSTRAAETLTSTQFTSTDTARGTIEVGRPLPSGRILVVAAATRDRADFRDERPAGSSTSTALPLRDATEAVAVEASVAPAARFSLGGGARAEWRSAPTSGVKHDDAVVGHASAVFQIDPSVSVRGSAASSHRWPTLNELVRNFQAGSTLTLANADLLPEEAVSFDGAVQVTHRRWLASAGGFHTVVHQAIANVTLPSGSVAGFTGIVRKRENAGDAHATGLEIDGEVHPMAALRLRGSATVVNARFRNSLEPPLEGNRLPQVPRVSGALSGDLSLPYATVISVIWHAASSQFDDDRNSFLIAPGYQADVKLGSRIGPIDWHVVVANVANQRVETGRTPLVTLAPGREVRVGVTWRSR